MPHFQFSKIAIIRPLHGGGFVVIVEHTHTGAVASHDKTYPTADEAVKQAYLLMADGAANVGSIKLLVEGTQELGAPPQA